MIVIDSSKEAVLDTSAIMSLLLKDSTTQTIESKISMFDYFHISDLTYYESFNTIWKTVQRNDISIEDSNNIMGETYLFLNLMNIHSFKEIVKGAFSLSVKMGITVYDASYVFLAISLSIPLITSDKKLINKIKQHKLNIL
jgi:predicted nucleic acid-binding protein